MLCESHVPFCLPVSFFFTSTQVLIKIYFANSNEARTREQNLFARSSTHTREEFASIHTRTLMYTGTDGRVGGRSYSLFRFIDKYSIKMGTTTTTWLLSQKSRNSLPASICTHERPHAVLLHPFLLLASTCDLCDTVSLKKRQFSRFRLTFPSITYR